MSRTALLSMNLQLSHLPRVPAGYLPGAVRALETARAAQVPVIHVAGRDVDPDLHDTLVTKVLNRRGEVITTGEWTDTLA